MLSELARLADLSAPGMARILWGVSPLWAVMCGTTSRRQLHRREALWEGSPRQDFGLDEQKPGQADTSG